MRVALDFIVGVSAIRALIFGHCSFLPYTHELTGKHMRRPRFSVGCVCGPVFECEQGAVCQVRVGPIGANAFV